MTTTIDPPDKATQTPPPPDDLGDPGRELWAAVLTEFELATHEQVQLAEACRIRDRLTQLRDRITADGVMIPSSQGSRLHPGIPEVRQQQLALARLLATLGVPGLEDDDLPASRGVRGVYTGRRS